MTEPANRFSHPAATLGAVMLMAACMAAACTIPDTEEGLEEFLEATADLRTSADVDVPDGTAIDFSGSYLMGVQTPLGGPILFAAEVQVRTVSGAQVIDLALQPLKTERLVDGAAREDSRTTAGDPVMATDIPFEGGAFSVGFVGLLVPADANPVIFEDVVADLTFDAVVISSEEFCGAVTGGLTVPLELDLSGSTFGARLTDDVTAEEIVVKCP